MSYDTEELREEIVGTFDRLSCVPETGGMGWCVWGRAPETVEVRRRREDRRRARMAADPEYLEKRRAAARARYHRNKKRGST